MSALGKVPLEVPIVSMPQQVGFGETEVDGEKYLVLPIVQPCAALVLTLNEDAFRALAKAGMELFGPQIEVATPEQAAAVAEGAERFLRSVK